ncbi:MAG: glycosyltransferase [Altibacter sp.]|uniref:glycosyltransferase n=1 Tax=Altibacter sp. TaxID=2024823 RepID=UPI001E08920F|nr:glycosyltransferase [Altibacter sp.]MBZ0327464.1 glycosyltransferase [Altibacter sp.]
MNNILIVLFNDSLGGAEQYLKMVAEFFLKKEQEVYVIFLTKKTTKGWEELERYSNFKPFYPRTKNKFLGGIVAAKRCRTYRNIHFKYTFTSHVHITGLVGVLLKLNLYRTKYFVARESTSIFKRFSGIKLLLFKLQYKLGYAKIDLLICQSEFMKQQLLENLPQLASKMQIEVIENPVDTERINNAGLGQTNLPAPKFDYMVSAGRLIEEKGFDILMEAFARLKKNHQNLRLIILGEGKLRAPLEEQRKNLDLDEEILLPGFVPNVYHYFRAAQICVVSSRVEGFPNVLLQMMSQNNNVVSTLCAGGIEKIDGVYTALPNDVDSLYEAIVDCLGNSNSEMGAKFQRELNSRDISSFMQKIDSILEKQPIK